MTVAESAEAKEESVLVAPVARFGDATCPGRSRSRSVRSRILPASSPSPVLPGSPKVPGGEPTVAVGKIGFHDRHRLVRFFRQEGLKAAAFLAFSC